jgi:hypothetical protein
MVRKFVLQKSDRDDKKWMVDEIDNKQFKRVHFGSAYHQSYPDHKNIIRKRLYIQRHRDRENWGKSGIDTSGFWSVHLLWNKQSLEDSIKDMEQRFDIEIKLLY